MLGVLLIDIKREGCGEGQRVVGCRINGLRVLNVTNIICTEVAVGFFEHPSLSHSRRNARGRDLYGDKYD